ncbi:Response regulator of zinc sigma-54-dependent two-component system [Labilithrix luteola]|uniref:Response regulator of zinc sigma-54-dependent two-component system n=1 Tax=Labilithrix luteola TaxID=1391654 RepID=A0A0K1PLY0_9BACT|nr:Response regulator of zinc sigma-54-dependent two-component system [Labilithrix luteola]
MEPRVTPGVNPGINPGGKTIPRFLRATPAPRLELKIEREAGKATSRVVVFDGDALRLGSHDANDVVFSDPHVSRFHCRIERTPRAWRVIDQDSLNGTRVSGVPIRDADLPLPDCRIELGDSVVLVTEVPSVQSVEILDQPSFGDLYGASFPMRRLFAMLERVCESEANVLIEGESGTGKELVATEIVRRGPRSHKPFVVVDCSAISPSIIESELFGHVRGAFTGADRDRVGAFESAQGGTIFLDEIGELPLDMQPKLLRALEAREIRRVGDSKPRKIDVRVIAATNRRLEREVNHGRFREDLYFRLSVVTVRVPPLRERLEDVDLLVRATLDSLDAQSSAHLFTPEVLAEMRRHNWPGNVRELRNFVERTVVLRGIETRRDAPEPENTSAPTKSPAPIGLELSFREGKEAVIADYERSYLGSLLEWANGNVSRAARKAKIDRMSLYRLMDRHGVRHTAHGSKDDD